jgi:UDP-glucose 4-epimerase
MIKEGHTKTMSKIAVIGSNSFIAGYVMEELRKRNHTIVGLQRHLGDNEVKPDQVYLGDIRDHEIVERVVSISDYVINLAGILGTSETVNNPKPAVEVNILGTLNVLNACRVWDRPFVQIAVGNHWMNNTYSITRTTAERFTLMYAKEHGVKANVVRALNAYGPRQSFQSYKKMMPQFILNALHNKPLPVYGDGEQLMDFIYVSDLAKFLVDTLLEPEKTRETMDKITNIDLSNNAFGNTYQCGEGFGLPVKELAQKIIDLSNSKSTIELKPMRAGEPLGAKIVADYQSPTYKISIDEGIINTIEYYKTNIDKYNV